MKARKGDQIENRDQVCEPLVGGQVGLSAHAALTDTPRARGSCKRKRGLPRR